jgi:hypothetical protein
MAVLAILALIAAIGSPYAEDLRFPANAVQNVKTNFSALGNGVADDRAAIQRALDSALANKKTVYFPNGTYRVSGKLTLGTDMYKVQTVCLQGQSQSGVVIRLVDNAQGFGDANVRQPLFSMFEGLYSNTAFHCYVRNMTFDVGSGNPGAIGLQFLVSNAGAAYNVTVRSSDPQHRGAIGIDCRDLFIGPGLIQSATVDGFDIGIAIAGDYSLTLEHINLRNQRQIGVRNWNCAVAIRDLTIANAPLPVQLTSYVGFFTIVDAQFTGGAGAGPAISNACQKLFLRNVDQQGYTKMVASADSYYIDLEGTARNTIPRALPADLSATHVAEYVSHGVQKLFDVPERTLNLPVKETPEPVWDDPSQWVVVSGPDSTFDAGAAIQNAFTTAAAQGKSTVYLKPLKQNWFSYQLKRPIRVRGSVRRFIGMGACIEITDSLLNSQNFVFDVDSLTNNNSPIVFERFFSTPYHGAYIFNWVMNKTNNPLVLRDIAFNTGDAGWNATAPGGSGELYIQNVCGSGHSIDARRGQKVWARQFNPECFTWAVKADSADVWIFGQKTEGRPVFAEINNNSRFELLGGDFEQSWGNQPVPSSLFSIDNSSASFNYINSVFQLGFGFPVHVIETQAGVTRQLADSQLIHINEIHAVPATATVARYDEVFLPLFVAGNWRNTTAAQPGSPQSSSQKARLVLIKRAGGIWLRPGDARGPFRFGIFSVNGRCMSTREISGGTGAGQLLFSVSNQGGPIPRGVYIARAATGDGKQSSQTMLINP